MKSSKNRLVAALLAAGCVMGTLYGCDAVDNLLEVDNPQRIPEADLDNPQLVGVLVNSTIGQFADAYSGTFIWIGSMLTDEQVTGINWEDYARINQREVEYNETPADEMFDEISEARVFADTVSARLPNLIDNATSDRRYALTLAYGGYSYILMGDAMCEASINAGAEVFQPEQLYQIAVNKLDQALTVANAAGAADVANFARAGLARAHLNLGNDSEVMQFAAEVPLAFRWYVEYSDANPDVYNVLYTRTHGTNHSLGVHPSFVSIYAPFGTQNVLDQTDPRIQFTPRWTRGHNGLTQLYKPFQPLLFSGYTGNTVAEVCANTPAADCTEGFLEGQGALLLPEQGTDIAVASGIGALHNYYAAAGAGGSGPAGSTLEFVNSRRAVGNQAPVALSGEALMEELREQRRRDLYMSGYRLGDLRRYIREGIGNLFPSGQHANAQWGDYGSATCFPIPREEYEGNPNLPNPNTP